MSQQNIHFEITEFKEIAPGVMVPMSYQHWESLVAYFPRRSNRFSIHFNSICEFRSYYGLISNWYMTDENLKEPMKQTVFNNIPQFTFMIIFPVFIGIMLALPGFISTAKGNGHWKVDWAKLFGVGLPALYITTYPLIYYVVIPTVVGDMALGGYTRFFISNLFFDDTLRTVSGLVLGYIILSVIQKPFGKLKEI